MYRHYLVCIDIVSCTSNVRSPSFNFENQQPLTCTNAPGDIFTIAVFDLLLKATTLYHYNIAYNVLSRLI